MKTSYPNVRVKAIKAVNASPVPSSRGGWISILEGNSGNWQRNVEIDYDGVRSFHAVYSCMTLIASDIAKLRVRLVKYDQGVWSETANPSFSPVLRKPNHPVLADPLGVGRGLP